MSATDDTNGLEDFGASCNAGYDSSFEMMIIMSYLFAAGYRKTILRTTTSLENTPIQQPPLSGRNL